MTMVMFFSVAGCNDRSRTGENHSQCDDLLSGKPQTQTEDHQGFCLDSLNLSSNNCQFLFCCRLFGIS